MTDEPSLLRAVHAAPGDDTPRLVYADWLEEHGGDPELAARLRRNDAAGQVRMWALATSRRGWGWPRATRSGLRCQFDIADARAKELAEVNRAMALSESKFEIADVRVTTKEMVDLLADPEAIERLYATDVLLSPGRPARDDR